MEGRTSQSAEGFGSGTIGKRQECQMTSTKSDMARSLEPTCVLPASFTPLNTRRRIQHSLEGHCRIVFGVNKQDVVSYPTSLVMLPYKLHRDPETDALLISSRDHIDMAIQIGKCLLDMNKAAARLSFWLIVQRRLSSDDGIYFRSKLKEFIHRARTEKARAVAQEMVLEFNCGSEYLYVCREVLEKDETASHARAYIRDPMAAALKELDEATETLLKCYLSGTAYFYLVDEVTGQPTADAGPKDTCMYPISVKTTKDTVQNFLPFMNLTVMSVASLDGLSSVSQLLGIPPHFGTPSTWKGSKAGLIYFDENYMRNAAAFLAASDLGLLQRSLRETATSSKRGPAEEMECLREFYARHDPLCTFAGLCDVMNSESPCSQRCWTSQYVVDRTEEQVELAQAELRLQRLQRELEDTEDVEREMAALSSKAKTLRLSLHSALSAKKLSRATLETQDSTSTIETAAGDSSRMLNFEMRRSNSSTSAGGKKSALHTPSPSADANNAMRPQSASAAEEMNSNASISSEGKNSFQSSVGSANKKAGSSTTSSSPRERVGEAKRAIKTALKSGSTPKMTGMKIPFLGGCDK